VLSGMLAVHEDSLEGASTFVGRVTFKQGPSSPVLNSLSEPAVLSAVLAMLLKDSPAGSWSRPKMKGSANQADISDVSLTFAGNMFGKTI